MIDERQAEIPEGKRVDPVVRAYGIGEVCRITGLNRITLHLWDKTGFLRATVAGGGRGTGNRRKYSFGDLVALRLAKKLRDGGVSLRALKKIAAYLKKLGKKENSFGACYLALSGTDVVMKRGDEVFSVLEKPGQYSLIFPLDVQREKESLLEDIINGAA